MGWSLHSPCLMIEPPRLPVTCASCHTFLSWVRLDQLALNSRHVLGACPTVPSLPPLRGRARPSEYVTLPQHLQPPGLLGWSCCRVTPLTRGLLLVRCSLDHAQGLRPTVLPVSLSSAVSCACRGEKQQLPAEAPNAHPWPGAQCR